ncbi:hypothetical protein FQA39_LY13737 [Lamprigera yunnana]|nr:hypothetical protein FQA39_LY13737 [Lamprigera yunnana]
MSKLFGYYVVRLIELIESKPCLWDKTANCFKDKIEKQKAWKEVYVHLEEDLQEKNKTEQHRTELQGKWRNLKTCFRRELTKQKKLESGGPSRKRHKYVYFDQLLFLLPTMEDRPTISETSPSQEIDPEAKDDSEMATEESQSSQIAHNSLASIRQPTIEKVQGRWKSARDSYVREYKKLKTVDTSKRRKEYLYFNQMKFLDKLGVPNMRTEPNFEPVIFDYDNSLESDDQNLQIKKERRYNRRNEIGVEADDCMSVTNREQEEQNDDQQFLNSLIPTLKLFTNDQKLIFRCEALKLLMNVKNNFTLVPTVHTSSTYSLSPIPQNIPPNHYQIVPPQSSSPVEDKGY